MARLKPVVLAGLALAILSGSAAARDCRPAADAPPGVRVPERPGCPRGPSLPERERPKPGREPGFVDLGNGTQIRIDGRVRVEGDVRR